VKSDKSKSSSPAKAEKPAAKPVAKPAPKSAAETTAPKGASKAAPSAKSSARADLRSRILQKKGPIRPIAFSLDEIREIAKTTKVVDTDTKGTSTKVAKASKQIDAAKLAQASQPHHIKAASLADILGFNPKKAKLPTPDDSEDVPEKFRRFYKLLLDLRNHLTGQIDTHSEETLKRSSKDDAGDLSSYGQHMADAGTDTFDRDFALSLVSSEQEALSEVEAAIKRIKDGTYGTCEITQKPIAKDRLLAVPFTRYSAEAQKNIERNRHRSRTQAGLFGELGEEGATLSAGGGDDGDE
jgi:RNA polymerase-binding transcription factor DksA